MPQDTPGRPGEPNQVAVLPPLDTPPVHAMTDYLPERTRKVVAGGLVSIAILHVIVPTLKIDAVFLGLLAFAALVLLFDIESIQWLGIKAKRRELIEAAERVREVTVLTAAPEAVVPTSPSQLPGGIDATAAQGDLTTSHRNAFDLVPPVDRTERLLWAVEQIRIELMLIAGNTGRLPARRPWGAYRVSELARELSRAGALPAVLLPEFETVVAQRNDLAHGRFGPRVIDDSAAQLALELLIKLREIPRGYHRVKGFPVDLYADKSLSTKHPYRGLLLENIDAEGRSSSRSVFPVKDDYVQGRYVAWEWDFDGSPDVEAWYMDPLTAASAMAYSESAWFSGREYPEQWGIEYLVGGPLRV